MMTLLILSVLAGIVLGMRLNVLVLIPAIGIALIAVAGMGATRGDPLGSIVFTMIFAAICLQAGYLGGSATGFFMPAARASRRPIPRHATSQRNRKIARV
jgi:hypothetical protein